MKMHKRVPAYTLTIGAYLFLRTIDPSSGYAMTNFYLDPDWAGAKTGTQSQPFASFTAGVWSTVNSALASDDVTIYLSARQAGADTEDTLNEIIDISRKTPNPVGTLTINGRSLYNSNDSSPTWLDYSGNARARVNAVLGQNDAHVKYNKVTIDGLHIVQNAGAKGVAICGDNWTVKNSNIEQGPNGASPLFLIVPTADSAHEGSSAWCPASTNIIIQNNTIHDSVGELIYVGGAGCSVNDTNLSDSNCDGKPSHSNIFILNNILTNCGSHSPQGDCIDMKGGLTNVTIRGNDISNSGAVTRAIVGQGIQKDGTNQNIIIERNHIHNHNNIEDAAIAIVNSWGTPNGYTVRNNVITSILSGTGIHVYGTQAAGVKIYNNTIHNASSYCISSASGSTVEIRNNVCLGNNGNGAQTSLSGTITSTNNAYSGTWGGTCNSCLGGLSSNAFVNMAGGNYVPSTSSMLVDAAMPLTSFNDDFFGISRSQGLGWDIGAYEQTATGGNTTPPSAPTGLQIR
jgi:hypothetical protein